MEIYIATVSPERDIFMKFMFFTNCNSKKFLLSSKYLFSIGQI